MRGPALRCTFCLPAFRLRKLDPSLPEDHSSLNIASTLHLAYFPCVEPLLLRRLGETRAVRLEKKRGEVSLRRHLPLCRQILFRPIRYLLP